MGEFWNVGFNSAFSVEEAASIGHVMGRPVVGAEAFTSGEGGALERLPRQPQEPGGLGFCQR